MAARPSGCARVCGALDRRPSPGRIEHRIDENQPSSNLENQRCAPDESHAHAGISRAFARRIPRYTPRSDDQPHARDAHPARGRSLDDRPGRGADPRLRRHLPDDQRGRGRARDGRARRQGRGARRHRLQVRGRHPRRRALDPPERQSGRRGVGRRRDRRARDDEGGRRGASAPLEEARALRARLEGDRGCRRERRARQRQGDRGRQGRPHPRPRRARLPAGVARRHPPRPGPGRVPRARSSAAR